MINWAMVLCGSGKTYCTLIYRSLGWDTLISRIFTHLVDRAVFLLSCKYWLWVNYVQSTLLGPWKMEIPWGAPYPGGNMRDRWGWILWACPLGSFHGKILHGSPWHTTKTRRHAKHFTCISSWILKITFRHEYYNYPHFIDEEVEALRGEETCP